MLLPCLVIWTPVLFLFLKLLSKSNNNLIEKQNGKRLIYNNDLATNIINKYQI